MISILYKCPHFYFPRVYSLRITFVDHRYSLIQARKERPLNIMFGDTRQMIKPDFLERED